MFLSDMESAARYAKETYDWPPNVQVPGARRLSLEEREERIYGQKQPASFSQAHADHGKRDACASEWTSNIHE